jgi:hypothetical protein
MDVFLNELESGEIHLRDKWHFELKSEFIPHPSAATNKYTQEFYIFIPNSLQINKDTYSKEEFYQNQTNFFRYKTPVFTFDELNDGKNSFSPLTRIISIGENLQINPASEKEIEYELKLLGNIVRSLVRKKILYLWRALDSIETESQVDNFVKQLEKLCEDLKKFYSEFSRGKDIILLHTSHTILAKHFYYIEEFINNSVEYYFTGLLQKVFKNSNERVNSDASEIIKILAVLKNKEGHITLNAEEIRQDPESGEFILYRAGLLNKYVLDALLLNITRKSPHKALQNVIGSAAAGVAMFVYFGLFVWQTQFFAQVFLLHTELFILATVMLYILKDRLKEGIKSMSYKLAFKWFPDYTTEIRSSNNEIKLGDFKESFSFIEPRQLPNYIKDVRNKEFHYILEDFARPENVMYYKKTIAMLYHNGKKTSRKYSLNVIFRFSIHRFLEKAEDAFQTYITYNEETGAFDYLTLPKVYHVNIILKNSFVKEDGTPGVELKKFRLIIDKEGIKRIEHLSSV